MAGDWIKIEVSTPDKEEVWSMAATLELDHDAVVGKLIRVWRWFDQHSEDGNARSVSKSLLDREVGVTGFCDAMQKEHWMYEKDGVISLTSFDKHNGSSAKQRANTAKRVAKHKAVSGANGSGVTKVTVEALPREEKRREEKKSKSKALTLFAYLKKCDLDGVDPIPEDSIVFKNAEKLGISPEYVYIAWSHFKEFWMDKPRGTKPDWVGTFNNCLKGDGYDAYKRDPAGDIYLTPKGKNTKILLEDEA